MEVINDYEATARVRFDYDPETTDPFFWVNPETGLRQWRMEGIYSAITTEQGIWDHLAYNAIINGIADASRLDGWADLPNGSLTMYVLDLHLEPTP